MPQMKSFFDLVNELSMKSDKKLPNLKVPVKGKKGVSKFARKKAIGQAKDDINAGFKTDANRKAAFAKMNDSTHSADKKPEKYIGPDGKTKIRMVPMDKEVVKKEEMQSYRIGHKSMAGNVHAKNPDDAMKQLRKKGIKGKITLTHRGPVSSLPKRRIPTREELDSKDKPFVKKLVSKLRKGSNTHAKQADDLEKAMKTEVSVLKPTKPTDIIKHAKTLAKNPRDYMMNKKKYLDKARAKVFRMYPKEEVEIDEAIKHTHAVVDPAGKVAGMTSNERDAKDIARRHKGKVIKLKRPMSTKKGEMMINRPFKEAINHDDAHRDAQTHSDGSMSVKKIPSMIKKPSDKHLHLHMKSYHKEKDGQDFAKKHGYKVKNYVKTPSGTRMDIHKEMVDPMDLRGRPKKKDPNPESPYGMKHPLHPANIAKKKAKEAEKVKKEAKTFDYFDSKDAASAHAKKHGGKVFVNTGKGATKVKGKPVNTHVVIKKEAVEYPHMMYDPKTGKEVEAKTPADHNKYAKMGYTHEKPNTDEALNLAQRMKRSRLMKRMKARIKIGRKRAMKKMANKKTIEKRAMRQARNQIAKKLTRGIPKKELTFARKQEIEKRLSKPALQQRIKRMAKRIFKDVRKKEVERKKG